MKSWKKIAVGVGGVLALLVAFDVTGRLLFPEKWAELDRSIEERQKQATAPKQQPVPQKAKDKGPSAAMYVGGLTAMDLANNGAVKPSSERVEALARKSAAELGIVDPAERRKYVDDWQRGFWVGWKSATR